MSASRPSAWRARQSASKSAAASNANGEPARARRLTNLTPHHTMPDAPEEQHPPFSWEGFCPYCGQPISEPPDPVGELEHN
jgi:hypothetical protein